MQKKGVRINALVVLVFVIFFVISFMTNIMGTLLPIIVTTYHISNGIAAFMPFSFFIAYGILSLPAGLMLERIGEKKMLLLSFMLITIGSLLCCIFPSFYTILLSSFLIGSAMAVLQVVINPMLRVSGGEENFAFNSVLAQLFFGLASYVAPLFFTFLLTLDHSVLSFFQDSLSQDMRWLNMYKVFLIIGVAMLAVVFFFPLPKMVLKEDEKVDLSQGILSSILRNRTVWFYFIGVFCYVGLEQGVSNWISTFLWQNYQVNPMTEGATINAYFWGAMTIGCFFGLFLLKIMDSQKVLFGFCIAAVILLAAALFGRNVLLVKISFPLIGFCLSVMYSIVFSLGLNSVDKNHGTVSGLLCSGIVGGAIVPLCIGWLSNFVALKYAMSLNFVLLAYLIVIAIRPRQATQKVDMQKAAA